LPNRSEWDAWYQAEQAFVGTNGASPETLRLFALHS